MSHSKVVELLIAAYLAELEMAENYLAGSVWLDGPGARDIAKALDVYSAQELTHAKKIAQRLKQLGVLSPGAFSIEVIQEVFPPRDKTDPLSAVEGVLAAERAAIARYEQLVEVCGSKDIVTRDLAIEILADEEKHHALFESFLTRLKEEWKIKPVTSE